MRIFLTGATGFIGSAIVPELLDAGHEVLGLTRSDAGAQFLREAGAQVHRGDIDDLESLRRGAAGADGVIHTAFNHDFSKYVANCEADRRIIEALGSVLAGSNRPLLITSGTGIAGPTPGRLGAEDDPPVPSSAFPRAASEEAAAAVAARGVRVSVVRLPQVHNREKFGLVSYAIAIAQEKGLAAYVGSGANRWPAVHRLDAARLYRLVLEKGAAGARYHAVAEEGLPVLDIAEVIARRLNVPLVCLTNPEAAAQHFGWLGPFVGLDCPSSSAKTQRELGWRPTQRGMIADLEEAYVFEPQAEEMRSASATRA